LTASLAKLPHASNGALLRPKHLEDGGDMTAPFGEFKQSGNGRDKSLNAFYK